MDIIYISHCVAWPPDKGERIRAFHSVSRLVEHHRVHLVCIARDANEAAVQPELWGRLASLRIEVLDFRRAFARGLLAFIRGGSFVNAFHRIPALHAYVQSLVAAHPIGAVVLLSAGTASYAPDGVPFLADWGDVDSEKWRQYADMRFPGFPQRIEADRLRKIECDYARRSRRTFLITQNELQLFAQIAPDAPLGYSSEGVDFEKFNPALTFPMPPGLLGKKYIVFIGWLSYFPNSDGVCWFAKTIFPLLRKADPELELLLVGRDPSRDVRRLGENDGITVTGPVEDVRPYLAGARAVIAPLRIARGLQNKVLEALAMGKRVIVSEEVGQTMKPDMPAGVVVCGSPDDYVRAAADLPPSAEPDWKIVEDARRRFTWAACLDPIVAELDAIEREDHGDLGGTNTNRG